MSDIILEINDSKNIIEIETSIANNISNIEIEASSSQTLEISSGYATAIVYASDIVGLDQYLTNFIDTYQIDCGTP